MYGKEKVMVEDRQRCEMVKEFDTTKIETHLPIFQYLFFSSIGTDSYQKPVTFHYC